MNYIRFSIYFVTSIFFICFYLPTETYSQIGITTQYSTFNQAEEFTNYETGRTFSAGIGYKVGLKNTRIEFLGDAKYLFNKVDNKTFHGLGIDIAIQAFIFDLEGDCDCPKIYKENDFFKKAFFLQAVVGYYKNSLNSQETILADQFLIGIGAGLDIGLTEHIILTPLLQFSYKSSLSENPLDYNYSGFIFRPGLRLGFYLD